MELELQQLREQPQEWLPLLFPQGSRDLGTVLLVLERRSYNTIHQQLDNR